MGRLFSRLAGAGRQRDAAHWLDQGLRPEARRLVEGIPPSGGQRVVVLGDSIPYGHGLADAREAYPALLEGQLRARPLAGAVQVVNAGISGQTILQGWARLDRHALRLGPALVVVAFGLNDIYPARSAVDAWRERCFWRAQARPMARGLPPRAIHARLERLRYRLFLAGCQVNPESPRVLEDTFAACLADTVRRIQAYCPALLLSITPLADHALSGWPGQRKAGLLQRHRHYNRLISQVAQEAGAALADPGDALNGNDPALFMADETHLSAQGQLAVAAQLAEAMAGWL